jgi:acyl-CoA thioester hydrolase
MKIDFAQKTSIRVRYGETDQMGYCYYGNYAQYFEVGRVEALRAFGMSYKEMEGSGVMLPVSEFNVRYFSPAYYDDLLLITTKIVLLKGPRLFFEYEIQNEEGKVISTATTTLVFVSKETMRPITPPADFLELMQKHQIN